MVRVMLLLVCFVSLCQWICLVCVFDSVCYVVIECVCVVPEDPVSL